jgi:hypothetical protein
VSRRDDLAVTDEVDVLAGALADEAPLVEQDRLFVACVGALGLGQNRVQVLTGGLGVRDQPGRRDPAPGRHLRPHPVLLALLAEVRGPGPDGDEDIDRSALRVEAHLAVTAEGDRPDIAGAEPVPPDQLLGGLANLLERVWEWQVVELGGLGEPLEVILVAEDRRPDLRVVAADSLEDARSVVQPVREHVDVRLVPADELPVLPDQLRLLHGRSV